MLQGLLVLAVALAVAAGVVRFGERHFIFFPAPYPVGLWDPGRLGVAVEEAYFTAADGTRLHGWWFPAGAGGVRGRPVDAGEGDAPVLLWCHGNAGNLTHRAQHAQVLADRGLAVFLFDYRGYGRSHGTPSEEGIYADAEAAYRYLVEERGVVPGRIVPLGRSLGAAPAARLAARHPHAGLILVSPFPSAAAMAWRLFYGLPLHWFARSRFPVREWVQRRRAPLLVIHGDADTVVPVALGRRVYAAAADPKELVILPGAGHNDILAVGGRRYLEAVESFARRCVAGAGV